MSAEKRISFDTYLKALALFTMANDLSARSNQFRIAMERFLGIDNCGHVSDAVYKDGATRADFDEALKREGILVAPPELE